MDAQRGQAPRCLSRSLIEDSSTNMITSMSDAIPLVISSASNVTAQVKVYPLYPRSFTKRTLSWVQCSYSPLFMFSING
jgi:hypothetical protein